MRFYRCALALASLLATCPPALAQKLDPRFFEREVRPLLLENCTGCHSKARAQGGVRLDAALNKATAEKLLAAIRYDAKIKMPPPGRLAAPKINALEAWVKSGATFPLTASPITGGQGASKHWAFQPVTRPKVPTPRNPVLSAEWVRNPIDSFVLDKLETNKLFPAPPAGKRALLRRLTYDLIGLPPTPEEIETFVSDKSPDAYEKAIDRLLASPHYGEKWGRSYLDLVRYAETNSYERDNPKPNAFRFRDYVIRSFNSDKPYDRFIKEQLAGDELEGSGNDGLLATGFYRLGIWDDEPADVEQAVFDGYDDIVTTIGQAFLGLTIDCARCHDHKIDPIPTKDYYQLVSFIRGVNYFKNGGVTDEVALFRSPAEKRSYEKEKARFETERQQTLAHISTLDDDFIKTRDDKLTQKDLEGISYKRYVGSFSTLPDFATLTPESRGTQPGALLDLNPRFTDRSFGLVLEATLHVPEAGEYTLFLDSDDGARLTVGEQTVAERRGSGGEGNERSGKKALPAGDIKLRLEYFESSGTSPMGFRIAWSGPSFPRRPLSTARSISPLGLVAQLALDDPPKSAERTRLAKLADDQAKREPLIDRMLVVTESSPTPAETFVLARGVVAQKGEKVLPGFLSCTGGGQPEKIAPTASSSGRRLALARWIASAKNPLTARVMVNRIWQGHFGRGLVKTPSDFGLQGARPTHPELLDWLATEFVKSGWSMKKLHRLILTSATYRMSSVPPSPVRHGGESAAEERGGTLRGNDDPENELLGRQNPRRLTAEEVRDSILAASGSLNRQVYGPSVYPDIPKEVLAGQSIPGKDWYPERSSARDKCRRSLYIFQKRSLRYPLLESFDAPETDRTTPARLTSVQPMQALSLLNSAFLQEQASALTLRAEREGGATPEALASRLFSLVTQRPATLGERKKLVGLLQNLEKRGMTPARARQTLALACLNLNEFLYLD